MQIDDTNFISNWIQISLAVNKSGNVFQTKSTHEYYGSTGM